MRVLMWHAHGSRATKRGLTPSTGTGSRGFCATGGELFRR
jgi:hypothetical protein